MGGGLWKGFVLISRPFIHEALVAARQHAASEPLTRLDGSLREYGIIDVCSFCVFPTTRHYQECLATVGFAEKTIKW